MNKTPSLNNQAEWNAEVLANAVRFSTYMFISPTEKENHDVATIEEARTMAGLLKEKHPESKRTPIIYAYDEQGNRTIVEGKPFKTQTDRKKEAKAPKEKVAKEKPAKAPKAAKAAKAPKEPKAPKGPSKWDNARELLNRKDGVAKAELFAVLKWRSMSIPLLKQQTGLAEIEKTENGWKGK